MRIGALMVFMAVPDYVTVCTGCVPDGTYVGNVSGPGHHLMFRRWPIQNGLILTPRGHFRLMSANHGVQRAAERAPL